MSRRILRATLAWSLLALATLAPSADAAPTQQDVFVIEGKGFGHGVGMAQISANAMARAGQSREQILNHFYPGTGRGSRNATLAVAVWEAEAPTGEVTVTVPGGARISDGSRSTQARAGAVLRLSADATGYHVREVAPPPRAAAVRAALVDESPTPTPTPTPFPPVLPSASPSPTPTASPSGSGGPTSNPTPQPTRPPPGGGTSTPPPSPTSSAAPLLTFDSSAPITVTPAGGNSTQVGATGRAYRGEVQALARQGFRLVNFVDVEQYLRGLGEVPPSWPAAALETQAVAARTYALRSVGQGRPLGYDLCDDTRCQVYIGIGSEAASTTAAARATSGEVVTFGGRLADTFYSANAGGRTASPGEGFGGTSTSPYLPSNVVAAGDVDAYTVTPGPADVAVRLGYPGQLKAVAVTQRGPSGRAIKVRLDGSAGVRELTGVFVARELGLRSSLFTIRRATGTAQKLAAPAAALTQLAPEQVAMTPAEPTALPSPAASDALVRRGGQTAEELPVWLVGVSALLVLGSAAAVGLVSRRRAAVARAIDPMEPE